MPSTRLTATFALGSFAVLGLAGCATQSGAPAASTAAQSSGATPASASSGAAPASALRDGNYSATGGYDSPGGPSSIGVALSLKNGVVTALKVVPKADNPTAVSYETRFASGVGALVVGKKLGDVKVTTVSGSSLTSQGFDAAIATIESKARQ